RDLGVMLTYEPLVKQAKNQYIKLDAGIFNGQGLSGRVEFDSYKDFISRLTVKPIDVANWTFTGGLSLLQGGWRNGTKYVYSMSQLANGDKYFDIDSSLSNL